MSEEENFKEKTSETNSTSSSLPLSNFDKNYEYNSCVSINHFDVSNFLFSCGVYNYFQKSEIDNILRNPILFHEEAIRLSDFIYTKNGIVSNI